MILKHIRGEFNFMNENKKARNYDAETIQNISLATLHNEFAPQYLQLSN